MEIVPHRSYPRLRGPAAMELREKTGQHEPDEHRHYRSLGIQLAHPTDDTRILVQGRPGGPGADLSREVCLLEMRGGAGSIVH